MDTKNGNSPHGAPFLLFHQILSHHPVVPNGRLPGEKGAKTLVKRQEEEEAIREEESRSFYIQRITLSKGKERVVFFW